MFSARCFKKVFISFSLILSCSLSALTLDQLQLKLTTQKLIRGDFTQSKTLQMFNQPLVSNGSFLLSHQQGLIWKQINPFSVSLVLVKNKLRQQFSGQETEVVEAKDSPMVFYFSHLFLSLFKGDLNSLESQFTMTLSGDEAAWLLHLVPKQAPLNKVFKYIEIKGKEQIEGLALIELNGDSSVITFSGIHQEQTQLTQQETDAFKF